VTTATDTPADCSIIPDGSRVTVQGQVTPATTLQAKVSLPVPQRFVLEQFTADLQAEGITWHDTGGVASPANGYRLLAMHNSPPLREIIRPMLKNSDNHMAEQLRWATLAQCGARGNALDAQYAALLANLCRQAQLPCAEMSLVDGCGLSRRNRVSPAAMTQLLAYIATSPYASLFTDALPIAGVDGTLKDRMAGTPAANNAHAKTGTMAGVCTLAGYVTTQSGERLVFSIFINGYHGHASKPRALQDAIVAYLAGLQ
jgi:D-alanyl-D-alanine carboxypeptidase/D-alanyl-D-alanine-endopeptidase (penicillin-binding protein 4)